MTTQIRTIEDILDVLNSDPEIRLRFFEVFGLSSLTGLYARMDTFETTQQEMLVTQRGMLETLKQHSKILERHSEALERQGRILEQHSEELERQGRILEQHSEELRALRQDVTTLSQHVTTLSQHVTTLSQHVTTLNGRADTMSADINTLKSVVVGNQAEDKAVNVIQAQLGTIVGSRVRRTALRYGQRRSLQPDIESYITPIEDAFDDGIITLPERTSLMETDLVFSGTVQGVLHWFPVEVSNTIDSNDVARVEESARLIEKVFVDKTAVPLAAGAAMSDEVRQHAADADVRIVTFEV